MDCLRDRCYFKVFMGGIKGKMNGDRFLWELYFCHCSAGKYSRHL